jgi:hypothetical protein
MAYRALALSALLGVAAVALAEGFVVGSLPADGPAAFWYYAGLRCGFLFLVAVAAGLAARVLHWWREYLGKAWTLLCAAYLFLFVSEVTANLPSVSWMDEPSLVLGNLCGLSACWLLARALEAAGLGYGGPPWRKIVVTLVALAVAVGLVHGALRDELAELRAGRPHPGQIVSAVTDIATFVLVAPLLLTTLTLRGGQLFWIYLFLTLGAFGWMVNQGSALVADVLELGDGATRGGQMVGYVGACWCFTAAALAQWLSTRRAVPHG